MLFLASDGITDFGIARIAQAKHCNLVFCSFVLRIDWLQGPVLLKISGYKPVLFAFRWRHVTMLTQP